ncbi:hypothetical protein [Spirillospora sp. NPDC047279]|uniref:hypothetical protein n=1 Tax=Spirillospora sp. NPDC047279 TaxID=3155478 RepID=UPI0033CA18DB
MTSLWKGLVRGAVAGAAGTTALNATTEADMAVRGRPASSVPAIVADRLAGRAGLNVPGAGVQRDNRLEGLGALSGGFTGVAVGALAGGLRAAGIRLPTVIGGPLLGAAAMAATDLAISRLKVSDPRTWGAADWASDAIPHLVYGLATHATLTALFRADEDLDSGGPTVERPARSELVRAAALGAATGCRSSAGFTALALRSDRTDPGVAGRLAHPAGKTLTGLMSATELGVDKHPATPARVSPQGLVPRLAFAAAAGKAVARRDGVRGGTSALLAATAAAGSATAGFRLRGVAARRFGSDLPGAFIEDAATAFLGWFGTRRPRRTA